MIDMKEAWKLHWTLFKHSVLVINQLSGGHGTGVFIQTPKGHFVLTAYHVVEGADRANIYLDLGVEEAKEQIRIDDIQFDNELDFACLLIHGLDAKFRIAENRNPFTFSKPVTLGQLGFTPEFALVGFPEEKSDRKGKFLAAESMFTPSMRLLPPSDWPASALDEGGHAENHFLFPYGEKHKMHFVDADGNPTNACNPSGFSGAGIWAYNESDIGGKDGWYGLAAIQTGVYRQSQCLVATQIQPVLNSMQEHFGKQF